MSFLVNANIIINALQQYYQESISGEKPVIDQIPLRKLVQDFDLADHIREGDLFGEKLSKFLTTYLSSTIRLHHPGYLGHQVAVPHHAGAFAALIDAFSNNPMAIYEMGPGAASIEYFLINWLLEKVGWQPAPLDMLEARGQDFGGGVLTDGGSLANLTALIAARSRIAPEVWQEGNPGDLALLAPEESHYSIARAAGILGIGRKQIYTLEIDERGVVVSDRLASAYQRLKDDGRRAVALVANACSTAVGLYDPLQEIGEFCRERDLWFHVDGAHGASALLSDKHKTLLQGVELADSLTWDAHKMMQTPPLCTAVLVRDYRTLDLAFQQEASYLFHDKDQPGVDLIHRTVECTKAGLGLKLFFVLAALGEKGMADYIDRQFQLTLKAYEYINVLPDFECAVRPQANILCFRVQGEDDKRQLAIRDRVTAQGNFYITSTAFNGKRYLRIVVMNPHTSMDEIKDLIDEIRRLKTELTEGNA